jgi:acetyl esterase/lipase
MAGLQTAQVRIAGHAQTITLRSYRSGSGSGSSGGLAALRPIILYFHGGGFGHGSLDAAAVTAAALALATGAWVLAVGYSLAPLFPFPAALEDGYRALQWAVKHAARHGADAGRIGVAGHEAGAGLATGVAAIARDRRDIGLQAQALVAPLLDPSLTCASTGSPSAATLHAMQDYADCYRAYLPDPMQRLHPYAAPLDSRRLAGLPAAHIASAADDALHAEAERYAAVLAAAGVATVLQRHHGIGREALIHDAAVLAGVTAFFHQRLGGSAATGSRNPVISNPVISNPADPYHP